MSRKTQRNRPAETTIIEKPKAAPPGPRKGLFVGAVIALFAVFVVGTLVYNSQVVKSSEAAVAANRPALESMGSPTIGAADAKVHIVEFLDPACETCALFYGHMKDLMAANPGKIRLSIRHVAFHPGSEPVVRMLEASRNQGKYFETLTALFATQRFWTINHQVDAQRAWPGIESIGLDLARLRADMDSPEVTQRIEKDLADAKALKVTMTPEYFVNGRPLPEFGLDELRSLVKDELKVAYH
jgi:protein-disulfide isomerase